MPGIWKLNLIDLTLSYQQRKARAQNQEPDQAQNPTIPCHVRLCSVSRNIYHTLYQHKKFHPSKKGKKILNETKGKERIIQLAG